MNLSFIKLDVGILSDTKIKLIRKMPEGDKLFMLWIGLLCLAMRSAEPGELLIAPGLPFNDETLSLELDLPLNVVRIGIETFANLKMIETLQDGKTIYLTNFEKYQNLEKIETIREKTRLRVQKHREKQKILLTEGQDVTHYGVTGNAIDKIRVDKKRAFGPNSNEFRLSSLLFNEIKKRDQKHKIPNLQKWCIPIDRLHRLDKREFEEIEQVINWSQHNSFWRNNILSTERLRKQFGTLYLQMKEEKTKSNNSDIIPAAHQLLI